MIYDALGGSNFKAAWTDPFSVANTGPAPLIAWLDCGSYEATAA